MGIAPVTDSLQARLGKFRIKVEGYRQNAGPGIVELTIAEANELDSLLNEFKLLLERAQELINAREKRNKK